MCIPKPIAKYELKMLQRRTEYNESKCKKGDVICIRLHCANTQTSLYIIELRACIIINKFCTSSLLVKLSK